MDAREARLATLAQDLGADVLGRADERACARPSLRVCETKRSVRMLRCRGEREERDETHRPSAARP